MFKRLLPSLALLMLCLNTHLFADELNLATYKGKVVYIDFWASWCGPCRQSFPWMNKLHQTKQKDGLVVIAVNLDKEKKLADAFLHELSPDFQIMFDPDGKLATQYNVEAMPSAYIIARDGKLRFKHIGYFHDKHLQYEQEIQGLLDETSN